MALSCAFSVRVGRGCEERWTVRGRRKSRSFEDDGWERAVSRANEAEQFALFVSGAQGERQTAGKDFGSRGSLPAVLTRTKISLRNQR